MCSDLSITLLVNVCCLDRKMITENVIFIRVQLKRFECSYYTN